MDKNSCLCGKWRKPVGSQNSVDIPPESFVVLHHQLPERLIKQVEKEGPMRLTLRRCTEASWASMSSSSSSSSDWWPLCLRASEYTVMISQGSLIVIFCALAVNLSIDTLTRIFDKAERNTHHQHHLQEPRLQLHLRHHLHYLLHVFGRPSKKDRFLIGWLCFCHA